MAKRVVVIASGETERRALPHLTAHLGIEGILIERVVIPPRNKALDVEMAHRLVSAAWFKAAVPPDKFVVLLDADGQEPDRVLQPFRQSLPPRLHRSITAALQLAVAQWHLEAWYFADAMNLKSYLGRAPGADVNPDEISNPKLRLKHLLGDRVLHSGCGGRDRSLTGSRGDCSTKPELSAIYRGGKKRTNTCRRVTH